ncbi:hypothetical protein M501DRAFT_986814 [Patellaria atrata CBS 101060]|uniref:Uncharacterized protein n=1 Tax=Patellaria atrata CBS 101060 TaxID=1346257 RepID=A0A9P4S848_9PEZI|nr:hypothetical protein M501DRAFT_986814 [Patellaria atrata CBS 101060]
MVTSPIHHMNRNHECFLGEPLITVHSAVLLPIRFLGFLCELVTLPLISITTLLKSDLIQANLTTLFYITLLIRLFHLVGRLTIFLCTQLTHTLSHIPWAPRPTTWTQLSISREGDITVTEVRGRRRTRHIHIPPPIQIPPGYQSSEPALNHPPRYSGAPNDPPPPYAAAGNTPRTPLPSYSAGPLPLSPPRQNRIYNTPRARAPFGLNDNGTPGFRFARFLPNGSNNDGTIPNAEAAGFRLARSCRLLVGEFGGTGR